MKIINRKAGFDYQILEKFECGIVLSGAEAKAIHTNHADLSRSTARIMGGEAYLINASIQPKNPPNNYQPTRSRKLLLHKAELVSLGTKIKQFKLTLVPLSLYTKGRLVKAELALAKPKRKFEKKQTLKDRDIQRDLERELRPKD